MNRLDFQPAGRFQRHGEESAGRSEEGRVTPFLAELFQLIAQFDVRHDRPVTKPVKQAFLHLRSGSLGIGHAQDLVRLGAVQQDIDDAIDQDAGLAGTGIGLDEDTRHRIGSKILLGRGPLDDVGIETGLAHVSPPSSLPPGALAHSPRRARWS